MTVCADRYGAALRNIQAHRTLNLNQAIKINFYINFPLQAIVCYVSNSKNIMLQVHVPYQKFPQRQFSLQQDDSINEQTDFSLLSFKFYCKLKNYRYMSFYTEKESFLWESYRVLMVVLRIRDVPPGS
jgi:hypothetical protein